VTADRLEIGIVMTTHHLQNGIDEQRANDLNVRLTSDTYTWIYGFQGGRCDACRGLFSFQRREYDPTLGRWMQQDPAGYVDGKNLYQALLGAPTEFDDMTGLEAQPAGANTYSNGSPTIQSATPSASPPTTQPSPPSASPPTTQPSPPSASPPTTQPSPPTTRPFPPGFQGPRPTPPSTGPVTQPTPVSLAFRPSPVRINVRQHDPANESQDAKQVKVQVLRGKTIVRSRAEVTVSRFIKVPEDDGDASVDPTIVKGQSVNIVNNDGFVVFDVVGIRCGRVKVAFKVDGVEAPDILDIVVLPPGASTR
jgi:RHS repeat-associated protein